MKKKKQLEFEFQKEIEEEVEEETIWMHRSWCPINDPLPKEVECPVNIIHYDYAG